MPNYIGWFGRRSKFPFKNDSENWYERETLYPRKEKFIILLIIKKKQ